MTCTMSSPTSDHAPHLLGNLLRTRLGVTLLLWCLLLPLLPASAHQRTPHDAEAVALRLLRDKGIATQGVVLTDIPTANLAQARTLRTTCIPSKAPYYIFDSTEGDAFVVVAGDSRMPTLLGWSDASAFPSDDLPEGLAWLLDYYACQHALLETYDGAEAPLAKDTTGAFTDYPVVTPLVQTRWGQGSPYNQLCPLKGSSRTVTGCMATAMAQILYVYRQPLTGTGSFAYLSGDDALPCSFDFDATPFDWDHMRTDYSGRYTEAESQAVAELMYACGVSVGMAYTPSGSGAYSEDVPYALHHFFGYNPNTTIYVRDYLSEYEWHRIICSELAEGRPIIYCGARNETAGHAFVLDGCDGQGLYHINWGWSGGADGYFSLDNLSPYGNAYSLYQDMICGITPDTVGVYEDNFYADTIVVEDGPIALGEKLHIEVLEVCSRDNSFSSIDSTLYHCGTVGIGLYDDKMNFVQWLDIPDDIETNLYTIYTLWYEIPMDANVFTEDRVWWLVPVAQSQKASAPTPMHILNTNRAKVPVYVHNGIAHVGAQTLEETSVDCLPADPSTDLYYDLQGRPNAHPERGIYITKGGKKSVRTNE